MAQRRHQCTQYALRRARNAVPSLLSCLTTPCLETAPFLPLCLHFETKTQILLLCSIRRRRSYFPLPWNASCLALSAPLVLTQPRLSILFSRMHVMLRAQFGGCSGNAWRSVYLRRVIKVV